MPYGNDDWIVESERKHRAAMAGMASENERMLRERLKEDFEVPDEFMDLAVKIWWDGKED